MIKEQIETDLVEAMKAHNDEVVSVLRMVKSAIQNSEIQKKQDLKKEDILAVIQNQVKQRQDSIDMYEKGNRPELAEKEKSEIEILKEYLPEQMDEEEIRAIIQKAVSDTGAASIQDMGKVMGQIMPQVRGKADGGLVSKIVKEELSK